MKLYEALSPVNRRKTNTATPEEQDRTRKWFRDHGIDRDPVLACDDGTINYYMSCNMSGKLRNYKYLPIKMGYVSQSFYIDKNKIENLVNTPYHVGEDFVANFNPNLKSLQGLECEVGGAATFASTGLTSLHNIHKHLLHATRLNVSNCQIDSHILGVLLIKGLEQFEYNWGYMHGGDFRKRGPMDIMEKYVQMPPGERDIIACQDELITAGFGAYAKL